jgi:DNA-binding MarR family transcriptional regulator
MSDRAWYAHAPLAALLLQARGSYGDAARRALAAAGFDDIPRNGGFVLAGLEDEFTPQADAVAFLRVSKQASSQLIDTLVLRGYLERRVDPEDRRRMGVRPTERGRAAAATIHAAIDEIDDVLTGRITAAELHGLRAGLGALAEIRIEREA